jgi:hypothetical protein
MRQTMLAGSNARILLASMTFLALLVFLLSFDGWIEPSVMPDRFLVPVPQGVKSATDHQRAFEFSRVSADYDGFGCRSDKSARDGAVAVWLRLFLQAPSF